jgi:hypothetical protein
MKKSVCIMILLTLVILTVFMPSHSVSQTLQKNSINPSLIKRKAINPSTIEMQPIGSVVISIRNSTGIPVGAASVTMMVNGQSLTETTNAQGEASFMNIQEGQYSYSVSKAGYYSPIPAMSVAIKRSTVTASNFILFEYGSAKVKVFSNTNPVVGASVSAVGVGKSLSGTTDAGGFVTFTNLAQGSYIFKAAKPEYAGNEVTVNIICGQEASVPISIFKFGVATVKVTCNGTPVKDVSVSVTIGNGVSGKNSDADGLASFYNLPPGGYSFSTIKEDYLNGKTTANVISDQVTVVPISITLNLGSLVVTVKDPNFGELVAGATVTLMKENSTSLSAKTNTTNTQGQATFGNLSMSTYKISAVKSGYSPLHLTESVGIYGIQPRLFDYSLIKLYTNVIVTVNKQGQPGPVPIAGATVNLLGSGVSQTLTTDNQGKGVLLYLQPGDYIVSVNKAGYINSSKDLHIPPSGNITAINLTMEMSASQ